MPNVKKNKIKILKDSINIIKDIMSYSTRYRYHLAPLLLGSLLLAYKICMITVKRKNAKLGIHHSKNNIPIPHLLPYCLHKHNNCQKKQSTRLCTTCIT